MMAKSQIHCPKAHVEQEIYGAKRSLEIGGLSYPASKILVLAPKRNAQFTASMVLVCFVSGESRWMAHGICGGTLWPRIRHALSRQKQAGSTGRFDQVPSDDEWIPLPENS